MNWKHSSFKIRKLNSYTRLTTRNITTRGCWPCLLYSSTPPTTSSHQSHLLPKTTHILTPYHYPPYSLPSLSTPIFPLDWDEEAFLAQRPDLWPAREDKSCQVGSYWRSHKLQCDYTCTILLYTDNFVDVIYFWKGNFIFVLVIYFYVKQCIFYKNKNKNQVLWHSSMPDFSAVFPKTLANSC